MGNPNTYYKKVLRYFAYCLASENEDWLLARQMEEEKSNVILENFIMEKKNEMDEKLFYYDAGRACQIVLDEAWEENCDAANASLGGIYRFECFIGVKGDDD